MARLQSPPILQHIRSARTFGEQAAALRALKNEVVGHIQKKELWIGYGVLEPVVKILVGSRSPGKLNGKDTRSHASARPLSEEETVRLQAVQILASFANGGPSFLPPLYAAGALPAILANICPFTNPPQIVLAALRVLKNMADAVDIVSPSCPVDVHVLADEILTPHHVESLNTIVSISAATPSAQTQVELATGLISRLCREERHQFMLANSGVLDSLATRLASFGVAEGLVIPGAEFLSTGEGLSEFIPEMAPRGANLAGVLEAIAAIISDSRLRACMLLCSPAILSVFPPAKFSPSRSARAPWLALEHMGLGLPRHQSLTAMDYLLPAVPIPQGRTASSQPALPSSLSSEAQAQQRSSAKFGSGSSTWETSRFEPVGQTHEADNEEAESPLIPWLAYLARTRGDRERLMAASVLTCLFKSGFGSKTLRETSLGLLVVPVLLDLLCKYSAPRGDGPGPEPDLAETWTILEKAPSVLARLTTDSEFLQKAAVECGAVKTLGKLLKDAYEPTSLSSQLGMWSPHIDTVMEVESGVPSCKLGPPGQPPLLAHRIRLRETALKAIAALAAGKEEYRKAIVEQDTVPYVVESLSQEPSKPRSSKERNTKTDKAVEVEPEPDPSNPYGKNPLSVVIAACHAVRTLSRSISILRTALVDYGVAMPMFRYLKHPDTEVQVVATAAICNLVLEASPMRGPLTDAGVLKVLCEHAHSLNPSLRLNALWALKHFVIYARTDLKKACLEELESGWLVQLICADTEDEALYSVRDKQEGKQAGGGLAGDYEADEDVEMDLAQAEELQNRRSWHVAGQADADGKRAAWMRQAETKLAAIRDSELNPVRKARNDDLAIQEQGLGFIRNLIGESWGPGSGSATPSETAEMIDFLFSELGQDRLFEILASKLRPRYLHAFARRAVAAASPATPSGASGPPGSAGGGGGPAPREARVLYPHTRIVAGVVWILVHMAASVPKHRQVVIAQAELLRLACGNFTSKDREVRLALCHLVANLTLEDSPADKTACAQRAHELRRLGFVPKLEALEQEDCELQVKEQAKAAVWQMRQFT